MLLAGYVSALIIGFVLGTLGGGGSILTVPVMVYLVGLPAVEATAHSLFVVGLAAVVGAISYLRRGDVDIRVAVLFAIPSLIAVYLTRRVLIPAIPEILLATPRFSLSKDAGIMLLFAVIMLLAAVSMIRRRPGVLPVSGNLVEEPPEGPPGFLGIAAEGVVVGTLTGLVGAGGGFLIVPALVVLGKLPMRQAVGTSLLIIAAKSLIGFLGDLGAATAIDWPFLALFAGLTIGGIILGSRMAARIPGAFLKRAFGWFVLVMGLVITVQEVGVV
ncbi:MAG: sulfite exporter TauE/SafE family protein [Spirochaetaceae bacterium]